MTINWGLPLEAKYLSFMYCNEWDRGDFRVFNFDKSPLGWSMNLWRLSISYDNYGNVKERN
ncbi:hypothetical protein CBR58_04385 [Bacillus thuringiensis]|uniref:Uncharacterized protein n=1 Tax=Bacillus thuringiensis TaxID=1428 RepID=A0A9X6Z6K6_BACTU|nr:hypothetical protein A3L20_14695 [Bacillus thuringiensis]OTZ35130.1 hypothetical protein BK763_13650 [Bacillus thuringiensis serovar thompsoni]MBG9637683.1 hypothetical protein [Bacillus thuringiensis]MBG9637828.1 hypothetical protein [Bacillus thuringiensis]MBG9674908.1 hypothetical protein [Bacillus thuringiensis]